MNDNERPEKNEIEKAQPERQARRITGLLRLWCVDETGRSNWRATLELPESGQRLGFATLEQLFVYLLDMCEGHRDI